jgi:hypothetical protein
MKHEMKRHDHNITGHAETRWKCKGKTRDESIIFSGKHKKHAFEVGTLLSKRAKDALMG